MTVLHIHSYWKLWTPVVYSHAFCFMLLLASTLFHSLPSTTKILSQSNRAYDNIVNFNQIQWFKVLITLQHISSVIKDFSLHLVPVELFCGDQSQAVTNYIVCLVVRFFFFYCLNMKAIIVFFSVFVFFYNVLFIDGNASKFFSLFFFHMLVCQWRIVHMVLVTIGNQRHSTEVLDVPYVRVPDGLQMTLK